MKQKRDERKRAVDIANVMKQNEHEKMQKKIELESQKDRVYTKKRDLFGKKERERVLNS